jgi:serine/threonine protein kinase
MQRDLSGRVLADKYRLVELIGSGGSGSVYEAEQVALERTVAVKILHDSFSQDSENIEQFKAEALAASRLNHPNTVSIIDYGHTEDGLLYMVMEYLRGHTLSEVLRQEGPLEEGRVGNIVAQILAGLEEAHAAGVIHADLKTDNIIVIRRHSGIGSAF